MEKYWFILVVTIFIFCDYPDVTAQEHSFCIKGCIPVHSSAKTSCANLNSLTNYEVSEGKMGGIDDVKEKYKQSGYTMCRFATCCTDEQAYKNFVTSASIDDFLAQGMGAQEGELPHQVFLQFKHNSPAGEHTSQCGGTIYNKNHIITANHCVRYKFNKDDPDEEEKTYTPDQVTVTVGLTDVENAKPKNMYFVSDVIEHPKYLSSKEIGKGFDLTVLRLNKSLDFSNPKIRALRIAPDGFVPDYKTKAIFSGWGLTERNNTITHLLKANLELHHPLMCQRWSGHEANYFDISDQHICGGGGTSGLTVGQGDSGGGLVCSDENNRPLHCGVASYKNCDRKCASPSIFMSVSKFTSSKWFSDATNNERQETSSLHNEAIGPEMVTDIPEYLVQVFGAKKDCAGVLVAPRVVLTSGSCVEDNGRTFAAFHGKTRKAMKLRQTVAEIDYKEIVSENATKILKDSVRKMDIGYLQLRKPFVISSYPKIVSADWKDGIEYAWPSNDIQLERRYYNPVSKEKCQKAYDFLQVDLSDDQMCAVEKYSGGSSCDRSLGSPLMCGNNVCGIASHRGCQGAFPNIFTDVSYLHKLINARIKQYESDE